MMQVEVLARAVSDARDRLLEAEKALEAYWVALAPFKVGDVIERVRYGLAEQARITAVRAQHFGSTSACLYEYHGQKKLKSGKWAERAVWLSGASQFKLVVNSNDEAG